jgi:hypothetical protein
LRPPPSPLTTTTSPPLPSTGIFIEDVDLDQSHATGKGFTGAPPLPLLTEDHVSNIVLLDRWARDTYEWKQVMVAQGHVFQFNNTHESDHHYGDDVTPVVRETSGNKWQQVATSGNVAAAAVVVVVVVQKSHTFPFSRIFSTFLAYLFSRIFSRVSFLAYSLSLSLFFSPLFPPGPSFG